MNILLVSEYVGLGGGETSLLQIAKDMKRRELNPIVLCPRSGPLTGALKKAGIPYVIQDILITKKTIYKIFTQKRELSKLLDKHGIDVIHCNGLPPIFLFGPIAKRRRIPLFWTCHGQWFRFGGLKRKLAEYFLEKVFCVSEAVYRSLEDQGFSRHKLQILRLGIDVKAFSEGVNHRIIENSMEGIKQDIVVGMIARFQKIKGQCLFVKAAEEVLQKNPDIKFVMIGGNTFHLEEDERYYQGILHHIQEKQLEQDIFLLGERKDVPDLLQEIDILVVPSFNESFGMVIIEGLSAKKCIIATACDGPKEILTHNQTGILVPVGDHRALASRILELSQNEGKRKALGERGYSMVMEQYEIGKVTQRLLEAYGSVKSC